MEYQFSAIEIAELASRMEEAVALFYRSLADRIDDEEAKGVFESLSQDEDGHRQAFLDMARVFADEAVSYEYSIDVRGILESALNELKDSAFRPRVFLAPDLGAGLDIAVRAEEASVRVYTQLREKFISRFHKVLDAILKAEANHCRLVTALRDRFFSKEQGS